MTESQIRYSLEHRVRICVVCGAALNVPFEGGDLNCPGCSTTLHVPPRNLQPLGTRSGPGGAAETPEEEQQRLATLRKQADNYNASNPYSTTDAPEGYEQLAYLRDGDPESLKKILTLYREAVQRCEQRSTPQNERLVYWLTWKLDNILIHLSQPLAGWSVIQTSIDLLTNPGYQHLLRSEAGNKARKAGDYESAEAWLALCDPAPTILDLDTEYRTTRGLLHLARGQWDRALALVGVGPTEVPHEPASRIVVGCLRVAALEKLGRTAEAEAAMHKLHHSAQGAVAETLKVCLAPDSVFAPARPAWARAKQAGGLKIEAADEMVPPGLKLLILAGFLGLLGMGISYGGIHYVRKIIFLKTWKSTKGRIQKVTSAEVGSGSKSRVRVRVAYTYKVDGKTYHGTRWNSEADWDDHSDAHKATRQIARLRANRDVTVHYNPKKPSEAVLDITLGGPYFVIVLASFFSLGLYIAVFFILLAHRRRKRAHLAWKEREGVGS